MGGDRHPENVSRLPCKARSTYEHCHRMQIHVACRTTEAKHARPRKTSAICPPASLDRSHLASSNQDIKATFCAHVTRARAWVSTPLVFLKTHWSHVWLLCVYTKLGIQTQTEKPSYG